MRVAVIGANGQLGTDCVAAFSGAGHDVIGLTHQAMEVGDPVSIGGVLESLRPDVVVNTAAMHNVESCEAEPDRAFRVNGIGPRALAHEGARLGFRLLHISTDYVFDGLKGEPYVEEDRAAPLNAYGNTKLSGEHFVLATAGDTAVVRTSGLYGAAPCRAKQGGLNFVQRMLQLARERGSVQVVTDEFVTPTYTADLAHQLVVLADHDVRGIVHATSRGECSWFEFARAIFDLAGVEVDLRTATLETFPAKVPRPAYSVLDNRRLRSEGIDRMPEWRDALASYLRRLDGGSGANSAAGE